MAARIGRRGEVLAFESHPKIFDEMILNISGWANHPIAQIRPFPWRCLPILAPLI